MSASATPGGHNKSYCVSALRRKYGNGSTSLLRPPRTIDNILSHI